MLYARSAEDLFEVVELYARFGAELPCFAEPELSPGSRVRVTGQVRERFSGPDGKSLSLLYDARTASWCYLSDREASPLPALHHGVTLSELCALPGGPDEPAARELLTALYQRGLLELDGKPSLDPAIFSEGPLFRRSYLIELLLTERCNLACRYCYAEAEPSRAVMSPEVMRRAVDLAMGLPAEGFTFQFAGGEAFTNFDGFRAAVLYIEEASERAGKCPDIISQSNGTLLTRPGVIDFLREHDINVGISIDGPAEIHDGARPYVGGHSSHADAVAGLEAVRAGGCEVVGALTVVGRHNIDRAEEVLDYFAELGIVGVRFNPMIRKGRGGDTWDELSITPTEYLEFMRTVTEYIGRTHAFREGNLESLVRNLVLRTRNFRCMRSPCGAGLGYMVITPEGDVYPCVHWLRQPELHMGNVMTLEDLEWAFLASPTVQEMSSRITGTIERCRDCTWRHLCEGGCALDARDQHGRCSPQVRCATSTVASTRSCSSTWPATPNWRPSCSPKWRSCRLDGHHTESRPETAGETKAESHRIQSGEEV